MIPAKDARVATIINSQRQMTLTLIPDKKAAFLLLPITMAYLPSSDLLANTQKIVTLIMAMIIGMGSPIIIVLKGCVVVLIQYPHKANNGILILCRKMDFQIYSQEILAYETRRHTISTPL